MPTDSGPEAFASAVGRAEHDKQRVVLTRGGQPVAALVPIEDVLALEALEDARDAADGAAARAAWETAGRPAGSTLEDVAAHHGITLDPAAE